MANPESIKRNLGRNKRALANQQTDDTRLVHLQRHFSEHPSLGLTPARAAEILLAAEQGDLVAQCELAEDLEEKDGHLYAELSKRKLAMLPVPWSIKPPRDPSERERQDAMMIQAMLEDGGWMPDAIGGMGDGILKGFACLEHNWVKDGAHQVLDAPEFRDSAWFTTHPERRNELRLRDNSYEGAELWPMGWIMHTHKAKAGYLGRAGLVRQLVWPFIFKNYSVRDLAEFLEIYGLPLRLGQYPSGASDEEKRQLMRAVMSVGHNAGGIMPKGMAIDFHQAADGQAGPFELMMHYMDRVMSKAILGATLTSGADGKSSTNALGNVHNEVRFEIRDADLTQMAATLSRDVVGPLYMLNGRSYHNPRRMPRLVFDTTDPEDITAYSEALPKLADSGMLIPVKWAHDKLQIPEPTDNEPVLRGPSQAGPLPPEPTPLAALSAPDEAKPKRHPYPDQQQLEQALDGLLSGEEGHQQLLVMIEPVVALIEQQGLDSAAKTLGETWPAMDDQALTDQLARVLFVAELWGQMNVEQD